MIGDGAGLDSAGPPGDGRLAVPAFPVVAFDTTPWAGTIVLVGFAHVDDRRDFRPVIARDNDESVLVEAVFLQALHQFADHMIELEETNPEVDWLEVHSENFFGDGDSGCR